MPPLARAKRVNIVTVSDDKVLRPRTDAHELARHLARHGVAVHMDYGFLTTEPNSIVAPRARQGDARDFNHRGRTRHLDARALRPLPNGSTRGRRAWRDEERWRTRSHLNRPKAERVPKDGQSDRLRRRRSNCYPGNADNVDPHVSRRGCGSR